MYYFDEVTFTTKCPEEESCVDISHLSVFSYRACAIALKIINVYQNYHHGSIPQP